MKSKTKYIKDVKGLGIGYSEQQKGTKFKRINKNKKYDKKLCICACLYGQCSKITKVKFPYNNFVVRKCKGVS